MSATLLVLIFAVMLALCFSVIAWSVRPQPEQTALNERLQALVSRTQQAQLQDELLLRPAAGSSGRRTLEALLQRVRVAAPLERLLLQANDSMPLGRLLSLCAALAVVASSTVWLISSNLVFAGAAFICFGYCPILRLQLKRKRRLAAFEAVLPDAIELCARSLRAGHSLVAAIGNTAEQGAEPVKSEFAEVFRMQNYGLPMRDALQKLMDRNPSADLRVLVTGIMVQKDTGGNLAEIMDHITGVIRDRVRIKGEIQVHTAQGRLTGWILCLLPVILLVLINVISPGYSTVLFHDPFGQKLLYGAVLMLMIGAFIIRNIVKGIEV